ncbi:MAG TPA: hypothetical protein VMJ93_13605 [Verrucomicrobiae bacterium]|nr:hypothetical protein [Verrucomicrobiae bacterium]
MRTLWRGFVRTLFWSFERGSWPYDLMVIAIVLFVLLTPRSWFRDQPQTISAASPGVQLLSQNPKLGTSSYRLDASLLPENKRIPHATPELERETHDLLSRDVGTLRGQTFQVVSIDPVFDGGGTVLSYDITIHQ